MTRYPYTLFTAQGLGISNSSLQQTGDVVASKKYGEGEVGFYVNAASGNLVVTDQILKLPDQDGAHEFYYVYNSQATGNNGWCYAHKKFTQLPNPRSTDSAVLMEADGHQTVYTKDPNSVFYFAPGLGNGTPWLSFDETNNQWQWYHPGTKIYETYNAQGLLISRSDAQGRTSTFEYNNNVLSAINAPSGKRYELRRPDIYTMLVVAVTNSANKKSDSKKDQKDAKQHNNNEEILHTYKFDGTGSLVSSQTAGSYNVSYTFPSGDGRLAQVKQSDNTVMTSTFSFGNGNVLRLTNLHDGAGDTRMSYQSGATIIADSHNNNVTIGFDNNSRMTAVTRECGYDKVTGRETTNYQYQASGQLGAIIHPDQSVERFANSTLFYGLLTSHTLPNGQVTNNTYTPGANKPNLILSNQQLNASTAVITRYVYDDTRKQFLRFEMSATGRITEYRPDNTGNIASKRCYISAVFPVGQLQPGAVPSMQQMQQWVAQQNAQQVTLTEYEYNNLGQRTDIRTYDTVDAQGNGVVTPGMSWEHREYDEYGDCTLKQVLQIAAPSAVTAAQKDDGLSTDDKPAVTKAEFKSLPKTATVTQSKLALFVQDNTESKLAVTTQQFEPALQRVAQVTDAAGNTTSYQYNNTATGLQTQITQPNGRVDTKQLDSRACVTNSSSQVSSNNQKQIRNTTYMNDPQDRPVVITHPDGKNTFTFFDKQNRLGLAIDSLGNTIEHQYDQTHRVHKKIQYNNPIPIDSKEFWPIKTMPPSAAFAQECLKPDAKNDRVSYEFFDSSNRLTYSVDTGGYITQTIYDQLNRKIGTIQYAAIISAANLQLLLQGQNPQLPAPDVTQDRCINYFYDNDNLLIGEQDAAGYVKEYKRDAAGRIAQKICYANPNNLSPRATTLDQARPAESKDDANTYRFYNAANQCVCSVNAEGFITGFNYFANGKVKTLTRYQTKVAANWNPQTQPTPVTNTEDYSEHYQYDLLERQISVTDSSGKSIFKSFDNMGHNTLNGALDLTHGLSGDGESLRRTEIQFDAWEQVTNEANPYITQLLAQIDLNNSLSPDQKTAAKAQVWSNQSLRNTFDPVSGLKLCSTDTLNNKTFYYYDDARRPVYRIDAMGSISKTTYNTFGDIVQVRILLTRLDAQNLSSLQGGYLSANKTLQTVLVGLENNAIDAVTTYQRDSRGLAVAETDPENNQTQRTFTAFKQVAAEQLPLTQNTNVTVSHQYETRGLETQTTKVGSNNLTTTTTQRFDNQYGKPTLAVDGNGGRTATSYDRLGRVSETLDPLQHSTTKTYDMLDRVLVETDQASNTTQHVYQQTQRLETIIAPDQKAQTIKQRNVFGETVQTLQMVNGVKQRNITTHDAKGNVIAQTDAMKNTTTAIFDTEGRLSSQTDANNVVTTLQRNTAGQVTQQINDQGDAKHLNLVTQFLPDALGRNQTVIDPNNVVTQNSFDRVGNTTQIVIDPNGLSLTTQNTFNAQKQKLSQTKADQKNNNQWNATYQQDSLARTTGHTVDPNGLNLQTQQQLDAGGRVAAEIDANGKTTYRFYDAANQERFRVDAEGGVKEWGYTNTRKLQYTRYYNLPLNTSTLNAQTTLAQLQTLIANQNLAQPQDTLTWHYYDVNGSECFILNVLSTQNKAIVQEKRFDTALRKIQQITYAKQITVDPNKMDALTVTALENTMQQNADPKNDRSMYFVLDANGRQRFILDARGVIQEQRFDNKGRVIAKVQYFNLINNPAQMAVLTPDQVTAALKTDPQDRTSYTVFDNADRILFQVLPKGTVTAFTYDANNNRTQKLRYAQTITVSQDYAQLIAQLQTLQPDNTTRKTIYAYDKANRQTQKTNAQGFTDNYVFDGCNNITAHTDKAGQTWSFGFDRANREILKTSPVTGVTQTQMGADGKIASTQNGLVVAIKSGYDKTTNKISHQQGILQNDQSLTDTRALTFGYTGTNQVKTLTVPNVAVDNSGSLTPGNYTKRPEDIKTLVDTVIFNGKNQKVCVQNAAGSWTFYGYDELGREKYVVQPNGAVAQTNYTNFSKNEIAQKIQYATKIDVTKLTPSATLTAAQIAAFITLDANNDRTTNYIYDQSGNCVATTKDNKFFYAPNKDRNQDVCGMLIPTQTKQFNAFKETIVNSHVKTPTVTSNQFSWFDNNGKVIATRDPNGYVKIYSFNAFDQEILRTEYANVVTAMPTASTTLQQLIASLTPSNKDRKVKTDWDNLGQKIQITYLQAIRQQVVYDAKTNVPSLQDLPAQDIVIKIDYTPLGKTSCETDAAGNKKYTYYDPRGLACAETGVTRGNGTPLSYHGVNAHGERVYTWRFLQGTQNPQPNVLPQPVKQDPGDQLELKIMDVCGREIWVQDAETNVRAKSYDAVRTHKNVREWWQLTNLAPDPAAQLGKPKDHKDLKEGKKSDGAISAAVHSNNVTDKIPTVQPQLLEGKRSDDVKGLPNNSNKNSEVKNNSSAAVVQTAPAAGDSKIDNKELASKPFVVAIDKMTAKEKVTAEHNSKTNQLLQQRPHPKMKALPAVAVANIDEKFETLDPVGNSVQTLTRRNAPSGTVTIAQTDVRTFNSFNEVTAEGDNVNSTAVHYDRDQQGDVWRDTKTARQRILFRDGDGKVTGEATSATKNLFDPSVTYSGLGNLFAWNIADLEVLASLRDPGSQVVTTRSAAYSQAQMQANKKQNAKVDSKDDKKSDLKSAAKSADNKAQSSVDPKSNDAPNPMASAGKNPVSFATASNVAVKTVAKQSFEDLSDDEGFVMVTPPASPIHKNVSTKNQTAHQTHAVASDVKEPALVVTQVDNDYLHLSNQQKLAVDDKNAYFQSQAYRENIAKIPDDAKQNAPIEITNQNISVQAAKNQTVNDKKINSTVSRMPSSKPVFTQSAARPEYKAADVVVTPEKQMQHDAWNSIVNQTDSLGNTTTFDINDAGKPIKRVDPTVQAMMPNNTVQPIQPRTYYGSDVLNNPVGVKDPNNNTTAQKLDAAGNLLQTVLADGVASETKTNDLFNRNVTHVDGRGGAPWVQTFNRKNKVTAMIAPSGKATAYLYNESDLRNAEIDAAGHQRTYLFDARGFVSASQVPSGYWTIRNVDRNNQPLRIVNPLNPNRPFGSVLVYNRNYFGQMLNFWDLGGVGYTLTYDNKMQLVSRVSIGSNEDNHGLSQMFKSFARVPVSDQNLSFTWVAGRLVKIIDNQKLGYEQGGIELDYGYDTEGRQTFCYAISHLDKEVLQNTTTTYDALGRDIEVSDEYVAIYKAYDPKGNQRRLGYAYNGVYSPTAERWNTFDNVDRVLIRGGQLNAENQVVLPLDDGFALQFGYVNNYMTQQVGYKTVPYLTSSFPALVTSTIGYDVDGLLISNTQSTTIHPPPHFKPVPFTMTVKRTYTAANYLQTYSGDFVTGSQDFAYDVDDNITRADGSGVSTVYTAISPTGMPDSQVNTSVLTLVDKHGNFEYQTLVATVTNYSAYFEDEKFYYMTGMQVNQTTGDQSAINSWIMRDANGNLNGQLVTGRDNQVSTWTFTECTFDGRIMRRTAPTSGFIPYPDPSPFPKDLITTRYLYSGRNNSFYGSYTAVNKKVEPVFAGMGFAVYGVGAQGGAALGTSDAEQQQWGNMGPLDSTFPPSSVPSSLPVTPDSNFVGIAETLGDPTQAPDIAYANGYNPGDTPIEGERLRIPQFVPMHINDKTNVPYQQFLDKMIASVWPPYIAPKPKPQHHHTNFFKELIEVIATAAICAVAAWVAPELLLAVGVSYAAATSGALFAATVGLVTAVGDTAFSAVASQFGIPFNWKSILETALAAAGSAYLLGPVNPLMAFAKGVTISSDAVVGDLLVRSAVLATGQQMVSMLDGNSKGFNFEQLFINIASTMASLGITSSMRNMEQMAGTYARVADEVLRGGLQSFASVMIGAAITRQFDLQNIITNTLGGALGMGIGAAAITQLSQLPQSAKMRQMEEDEQEQKQQLRQQQTDFFNQETQADANFATANAQMPDPTLDPNNPDVLARAMQMGDALSTQQLQNQTLTDAKANTPLTSAFDAVSAGVNAANNYAMSQVPSIAIGAGLAAAAPVLSPAGTAISAVGAGVDRVNRWNTGQTQSNLVSQQGLLANNNAETNDDNIFLELTHTGLGVTGIATGVGEFSNVVDGYWKGANGNWYDLDWGGNQYAGARSIVVGRAEMFRAFGVLGFVLSTAINVDTAFNNFRAGDNVGASKSGLDIAMDAIAFAGPEGLAVSATYFALDKIGWNNALNALAEVDTENREVTGTGIWQRPK